MKIEKKMEFTSFGFVFYSVKIHYTLAVSILIGKIEIMFIYKSQ